MYGGECMVDSVWCIVYGGSGSVCCSMVKVDGG